MADRSVFSVSEIGMGGSLLLALMVVLALVLVPLSIMLIASELLGYRFARSVLFDRNAERVHVLLDKSTPWRGRWHSIASFDWRCIQAEVDTMHVFTGTVGRSEIGLRCLVMDQPGGTNVVDQFSLGINMPAHHVQPILDTWEHVRRFMQHEGPLFADAEDGPNPELGTQPLWRYLWMFPELMLEGIRDFCVLAWRNKSPLALLFALGGMVVTAMLLPLLMIFGLFPWISSLAKREPTWPAEILASVGGNPLSGNDLAVWRTVVPEPTRLSPPPGLQALHR